MCLWLYSVRLMIHILKAEYLGDYRVRFTFSDGREGVVDLRPVVLKDQREAFLPLQDPSVFKRLFIDHGALCWPDGPDIAPEYIYFLAFQDDEALRELFEEWGYMEARVVA
jgi:hypothetical protein